MPSLNFMLMSICSVANNNGLVVSRQMHTIYQVGLTETDPHIQFFWNVLESFSSEEICRFIKFACNQERLPQICPCQTLGPDAAHVPPYPMKIAPPDNIGVSKIPQNFVSKCRLTG